jgi:peptide methionine sulfoxide reductase msrA/msrB
MKKYKQLTEQEAQVILHQGTERPFTGEYEDFDEPGVYVCRQCQAPLYQATTKFASRCGWPSFDAEIPGMVLRREDVDGRRTEIICANCNGHLGHVFSGEGYTAKNTRHCVNSISLQFVNEAEFTARYATAVFASGCYWGTEYWFRKAPGVYATTVGYAGGQVPAPSYRAVCTGTTGHAESVRVYYDPTETSYEELVKLFFETHDPTQIDGQGPDRGTQYRSVIFYHSHQEQEIAQKYRDILQNQGVSVVTAIEPLAVFYAEQDVHHHHYYEKNQSIPYCHFYQKKF